MDKANGKTKNTRASESIFFCKRIPAMISWLSYDSLNVELPDGYLYFLPIINWGKYREENGKLMMPVSVRLNHAIADGYLVANVFRLLENEILDFVK